MGALSTTEAQYVSLLTAVREIIWLRGSGRDLELYGSGLVHLIGYEQTALGMTKEAMVIKSLKHIAIYYHFIWEKMEQCEVVLQYVPSKQSVVDILTKGLVGPCETIWRN